VIYRQDRLVGFSPSSSPLGSVIKMVFGAWEVSVMIASSIFAGVSLTVRHQWHYILSLLWWCPAGRCSDSHDWHCLFCGTDPAPWLKFLAGFHGHWEEVQNLQMDTASLWTYGRGFQLHLYTTLAYFAKGNKNTQVVINMVNYSNILLCWMP